MPSLGEHPANVTDVRARLMARRDELARLHALVDGAALCEELLEWLEGLRAPEEPLVTLAEASRRTGYSADHLGRMIRTGALANHGRKHRPLVLLSECPRRAVGSATQLTRSIADRSTVRSTRR